MSSKNSKTTARGPFVGSDGMFVGAGKHISSASSTSAKTHLPRLIRNLEAVFHPKSVAVIGASREPQKLGHVILRNFLEGGFWVQFMPSIRTRPTCLAWRR